MLALQLRSVHSAWEYRRVLTLLVLDRVGDAAKVSRLLRVGRRSIYRWLRSLRCGRSGRNGASLLDRRVHSGRKKSYGRRDLFALKELVRRTPQEYGYIEVGWSLPLLRDCLAQQRGVRVSVSTLRRQLRELKARWTRFGYEFETDPELEKKTPYQACSQALG